MELEQPNFAFRPVSDNRRRLDEPLPVDLEAVADMHLPVPLGAKDKFVQLYVDILEFALIPDPHFLAFQADNFALRFDLPPRGLGEEDFRPVRVIVQSLAATQSKLVEAEIEFQRQKSITPGHESLVLKDPDGNWLEIRERREIG